MVEEVLGRYGRLDILVNNAGAPQGADRNEIEDVPVEAWDRTMGVNARGAFLMSRAAVPAMRKAGGAASSAYPRRRRSGPASIAPPMPPRRRRSSASPSRWRFDLAPCGITVNAVCPGPIRTSRAISTNRREYGDDLEIGFAERAKAIPVGRFGTPDEVAGGDRVSRLRPGRFRDRPGDRRRRRVVNSGPLEGGARRPRRRPAGAGSEPVREPAWIYRFGSPPLL